MTGERQERGGSSKRIPLMEGLGPTGPGALPDLKSRLAQNTGVPRYIKIGSQWYYQADNGHANTLFPVPHPGMTPEDVAKMRATAEQATYVKDRPLAGLGYALATLAGASPEARDRAMRVLGVPNEVMLSLAPTGPRARGSMQPPPAAKPAQVWKRPLTRYGATEESGQATYANATLTKAEQGKGKRARRVLLPGMVPGLQADLHRSHLIARSLGGTARNSREAVALGSAVNSRMFHTIEKPVAKRVRAGEVIEYFVKPIYDAAGSAPAAVAVSAVGQRGEITPKIFFNPPGVPR